MNTSLASLLKRSSPTLFPRELIQELQGLSFRYVQDKNPYPEANPQWGPVLREKLVFDSMPASTMQTLSRIMEQTYGQSIRDGRDLMQMGDKTLDPQNVEIVGKVPLDTLQSCGLKIEGRGTGRGI